MLHVDGVLGDSGRFTRCARAQQRRAAVSSDEQRRAAAMSDDERKHTCWPAMRVGAHRCCCCRRRRRCRRSPSFAAARRVANIGDGNDEGDDFKSRGLALPSDWSPETPRAQPATTCVHTSARRGERFECPSTLRVSFVTKRAPMISGGRSRNLARIVLTCSSRLARAHALPREATVATRQTRARARARAAQFETAASSKLRDRGRPLCVRVAHGVGRLFARSLCARFASKRAVSRCLAMVLARAPFACGRASFI